MASALALPSLRERFTTVLQYSMRFETFIQELLKKMETDTGPFLFHPASSMDEAVDFASRLSKQNIPAVAISQKEIPLVRVNLTSILSEIHLSQEHPHIPEIYLESLEPEASIEATLYGVEVDPMKTFCIYHDQWNVMRLTDWFQSIGMEANYVATISSGTVFYWVRLRLRLRSNPETRSLDAPPHPAIVFSIANMTEIEKDWFLDQVGRKCKCIHPDVDLTTPAKPESNTYTFSYFG